MQDVINKVAQVPTGGHMVTVEALRVLLAQAVAALGVVVVLQGTVPGEQGDEYGQLVGHLEKIVGGFE